MKSARSGQIAKHPAKRGDVLNLKRGEYFGQTSRKRTRVISVRVTDAELAQAQQLAHAAAVDVSTYARDRLLEGSDVSRETGEILAAVGRVRELLSMCESLRLTTPRMTLRDLAQVEARVAAIDKRVLIAKALGR